MKRFFLFAVVAVVSMLFSSCSSTLLSQTNILKLDETKPVDVTDVMADLEVSPNKIAFFYVPSKAVSKVGYKNTLKTAVREALIANGNADVLVHLDEQAKLNSKGKVVSIAISGYPAKYVNFRSMDEKYILELTKMYLDLNLKLNENVANVRVPNLIPNIHPHNPAKHSPRKRGGNPLSNVLETVQGGKHKRSK